MRNLILAVACVALVAVVPHLLPNGQDDEPTAAPIAGASIYAADGAFVRGAAPEIEARNLIVVLLDTVRRDAVGLGDEPGRQMPNLTALAKRGITFRQATSVSSWTIPTVASVLTGLLPADHNCGTSDPAPRLLASIATYPEILRTSYGYQTAAYSDLPWHRTEPWSALQGFTDGTLATGSKARRTRPLESGFWLHGCDAIVSPWVDRLDRDRPFFLFLHTFDAHDPYGEENHPPKVLALHKGDEESRRLVAAVGDTRGYQPWQILQLMLTSKAGRHALVRQHGLQVLREGKRYSWEGYRESPRPDLARSLHDKYLRGVRWTDEGLGKLVSYLETSGLMDNTLLVVFSDHGASFGEHGMIGHGRQLGDELIHVPMVMLGPGPFSKPKVIDASVGVIDIMPTFMDWIGAADVSGARGRSLLPLIHGEGEGRPVISQVHVVPEWAGTDDQRLLESVRDERWKYIVEYDIVAGSIRESLFDLLEDPREQADLLVKGRALHEFPISRAFCEAVETCRDRIWEAAASIRERGLTVYSAGVPTTDQPRPAACSAKTKGP